MPEIEDRICPLWHKAYQMIPSAREAMENCTHRHTSPQSSDTSLQQKTMIDSPTGNAIVRQATDAVIKQMHDATERDFVDRAFLAWLYRRLERVHGESKDVDYMLRFRKIIDTPDNTTTLQQKTISDLMDERDELALEVERLEGHISSLLGPCESCPVEEK